MAERNLRVPYKSQWDEDARKTANDCGPASIAMILAYYGQNFSTDQIFEKTGAGQGLITFNQLKQAIEACGFEYVRKDNQTSDSIKQYIDQDVPVIALVKYGSLGSTVQDKNFKGGHFFTVVGYRDDGYFVNDPNFKGDLRDHGDHHFYPKSDFERAWSDATKDGNPKNSLIIIPRKSHTSSSSSQSGSDLKYTEQQMKEERERADRHYQMFEEQKSRAEGLQQVVEVQKTNHDRFVEKVAQLLGSTSDENGVIQFATNLGKVKDNAGNWEDKYEREVQARKQDYLDHQAELKSLKERIDAIEIDHNNQIRDIQDEHKKHLDGMREELNIAIQSAQVAEEALKTATKFASFWKWVVNIFTQQKGPDV